jgi:hypothetical protein
MPNDSIFLQTTDNQNHGFSSPHAGDHLGGILEIKPTPWMTRFPQS